MQVRERICLLARICLFSHSPIAVSSSTKAASLRTRFPLALPNALISSRARRFMLLTLPVSDHQPQNPDREAAHLVSVHDLIFQCVNSTCLCPAWLLQAATEGRIRLLMNACELLLDDSRCGLGSQVPCLLGVFFRSLNGFLCGGICGVFLHLVCINAHGFCALVFLIKTLAFDVSNYVEYSRETKHNAPGNDPRGALRLAGNIVHEAPSLNQSLHQKTHSAHSSTS